MATDLERLVVQLSADVRSYERQMARAQGITNRTARQIEGRFARMNRLASGSLASFGKGFGGAIAAGFSVQGAGQLIDAATRINNALKVAGLSGAELEQVYQKLFQSATRNAAPLESLVTLYGRAALVQKELGVSSEELLRFTDNVALALRVSGKSAAEASGALLQLSQALGSGVVRAEEFNSILEGAPTIAQAVAAGLKEAGGSVARLRQLVVDGAVSSEAFFRAFEAGAPILEQKVANSVLTISQRMTNLQTSLVNAAREFNNSTQVAETFGRQIDIVAEFVNSIDFDNLISQIRAVANEFGLGVDAARSFFSEIGRLTGLEEIGGLLTGGAGRREFLGGALVITSQSGIQDRIDGAFAQAVETAGALTEEAIQRSAREFGGVTTAPKAGRLTTGAGIKTVSLEDFAVPLKNASKEIQAASIELIKKFEGFLSSPKWDVNAFRAGFGSDTVTLADGSIQKITKGMSVSITDANRDLERRIADFQKTIEGQIGVNTFRGMNENQQAALTSIAYNYGSLPQRIVDAIKTGNVETVTNAIKGLGSDNGGINRNRRNQEADIFLSGAPEGLQQDINLRREQQQIIQETIASIQQQNASIAQETSLIGASNAEKERQRLITETLNELARQGIEITPQLRAAVEAEANARFQAVSAYDAQAEAADRLREKQEELARVNHEIAGAFQGALKGFISDLVHGKDATEALADAVAQLADRLLDIALNQIFSSLFGGLGGGFGGGFFGFAKGGIAAYGKPRSLPQYAGGGVSKTAAIFGEAGPEAAVPLPDGRRIPVDLRIPRVTSAYDKMKAASVDARTTIINRFDSASFLAEALSQPAGQKLILNVVKSQPAAFRGALQA